MTKKICKINFNEYYLFLWETAKDRGFDQAEFMKYSGLPKQRHNNFMRAVSGEGNVEPINVTAHYFLKLLDGLRITEDYVSKKTGKKFTEDQIVALRNQGNQAWLDRNQPLAGALATNKKLTEVSGELSLNKKLLEEVAEFIKSKKIEAAGSNAAASFFMGIK